MDIVPLLDDELLDGYRGGLAVLNNAESKAAIDELFSASSSTSASTISVSISPGATQLTVILRLASSRLC